MKITIRTKILIGFALLFAISILTQIFTYFATQNNFLYQLNSSLTVEADKGAGEIESFFSSLYSTSDGLETIYQDNYNTNNALGPAKISTASEYVLNQESEISQITYLSPAGREMYEFNIHGEVPQGQLSNETATTPFLLALSGKTSISQVYYLASESGPQLEIYSPIYGLNNGNYLPYNNHKKSHESDTSVIAILKMQISLESLSQSIGNIKVGQSGFMYVVDNTGLLIAHPNQSFMLQRPNLSSRKIIALTLAHKPIPENDSFYVNENNIPVIAKTEAIPQINWVAVIEEPVSEAYGFIYFVRNIFYATFAGSAILLIIVAYLLSKNITDPIKKLKENVESIEKGQLQVSTIIESHDEIEILSRSFNSMIKELLQRELLLKNEKQETENEKARLLASINNLSLGFILTNNEDKIIDMNQTLSQIIKSDEKKFETIDNMFSYLGDISTIKEGYQKCKEEKKLQRIDEVKFGPNYLRFLFSPVLNSADESIGTVALVEDISEAKLLDRAKDEFFAVASHELRTPLTAIRGYTSLILESFGDKLSNEPTITSMITNIHKSALRLINVVNDFLDASKLEQGKTVFYSQSVQPIKLMEEVITDLKQLTDAKHLSLEIIRNDTSYPDIEADPDRLKQILINLIGNAVKFTEKGGITVSFKRDGDFVKFYIKDTGIGISEEYKQLLFRKFQQAGEKILTRDASTGSGMGLYICKLLTQAMHGTIYLEDTKLGEGTTFSVSLPVYKTT